MNRLMSVLVFSLFVSLTGLANQDPRLETVTDRNDRATSSLAEEVRHQLVTLPYYSVFDWLQANVQPDGSVMLAGETSRPTLKKDAESRVAKLEGVQKVTNNIEVLPLSNFDDDIRVGVYRAIYRFDTPLFKYALQSVGPIHIIVKNGHVTLKGVVDSQADSQIAYISARGVSGAFDVKNELQVVSDYSKPIS